MSRIRATLLSTGGPDAVHAIVDWFASTLGWRRLPAPPATATAPAAAAAAAAPGLLTGRVHRRAVHDGRGNAVWVTAYDSVSRLRALAGKPDLCRLAAVEILDGNASGDESSTPPAPSPPPPPPDLTNVDLFRLSFGNSATVVPSLQADHPADAGAAATVTISGEALEKSDAMYLKELVLGCSSAPGATKPATDCAHDALPTRSPGLYRVGEATSLRVLPSPVSSLIFRVPSLAGALDRPEIAAAVAGKIGFRAHKQGQLLLKPPFAGIDMRLCEREESEPFFHEGNDVVMERVLKGIGDVKHTSQLHCGEVIRKEWVGLAKRDRL